ncbi:MAG: hypothetical protein ACRCXT_00670 [Paraclostridium sp.]
MNPAASEYVKLGMESKFILRRQQQNPYSTSEYITLDDELDFIRTGLENEAAAIDENTRRIELLEQSSGGGIQNKLSIKKLGLREYDGDDKTYIRFIEYPHSIKPDGKKVCYENSKGSLVFKDIKKHSTGDYYFDFDCADSENTIPWDSEISIFTDEDGSIVSEKYPATYHKYMYTEIYGVDEAVSGSLNMFYLYFNMKNGLLSYYFDYPSTMWIERPSTGEKGTMFKGRGCTPLDGKPGYYKTTTDTNNGTFPYLKSLKKDDRIWFVNDYTDERCSNIYTLTQADINKIYGSGEPPYEVPTPVDIVAICNTDWKTFVTSPPHGYHEDKVITCVYDGVKKPAKVINASELSVDAPGDHDTHFIQFFDEMDHPITNNVKSGNLDVHFH